LAAAAAACLFLLFCIFALLYAARRFPGPCPARFSWVLENPYTKAVAGSALLVRRAGLRPGMRVLDAGCGPGRLTIPAARAVREDGAVVALDVQPKMLAKVAEKVKANGLTNVQTVEGALGRGALTGFKDRFDRVLLATVLGEIRDKKTALAEIYEALKPGGLLSVTEMVPDPHFQKPGAVRRRAEGAGFRFVRRFGPWFAFTMNFVKPNDA